MVGRQLEDGVVPVAGRLPLLVFERRPGPIQQALPPVGEPLRIFPGSFLGGLQAFGLLGTERPRLLAAQVAPGAVADGGDEVIAKSAAADAVRREAALEHAEEDLLED